MTAAEELPRSYPRILGRVRDLAVKLLDATVTASVHEQVVWELWASEALDRLRKIEHHLHHNRGKR